MSLTLILTQTYSLKKQRTEKFQKFDSDDVTTEIWVVLLIG